MMKLDICLMLCFIEGSKERETAREGEREEWKFKYSSKLTIKGRVRVLVLDASAYPPSPAQPPQLGIAHS